MAISIMYAGKSNSPRTYLSEAITASSSAITVDDPTVLPDAPNLAVLGTGNDAEVILYTKKEGNILSNIVRGVGETSAMSREKGAVIARNLTLFDYKTLCENIIDLDTRKRNMEDKLSLINDISGVLPVANGGTGSTNLDGLKSSLSLGSLAYKSSLAASDIPDLDTSKLTSGTLSIARGGTGANTLANARRALYGDDMSSAAGFMLAINNDYSKGGWVKLPLPISMGGTGKTSAADAWTALGGGAIGKKSSLAAADIPSLDTSKLTSGTLAVARGGTGAASHTANAVLTGNGSNAVKNVATASGAFYATAANGAPAFGTLPVAQGGTGMTSNPSMLTNLASGSAASVFASAPRPGVTGVLGIGNGGTGANSRLNAIKNLTNENVGADTTHLLGLKSDWSKVGYATLQEVRNKMGLGNTTGALPVANGGTGATAAAGARTNLGITDIATRPNYVISNVELTDGSSALANGTIYFCY